MRLTTRMHGYTDYLLSLVLLVIPWAMGFGGTLAGAIAMGAGAVVLLLTLTTNFEAGVIKRLEVPVHLWIDGVLGLLLAVSPWVLVFDRTTWVPHLAAGILLVILALLTNTIPERDRRSSDKRV